jgi:hypothetical protein
MLNLNLTELIEQQVEVQLGNINTSMPGTVVSYNPATNRAVVKPTLPKRLASEEPLESPQVVEVPVLFPSSGNGQASLTFPLQPGDGVMLSVQQRSLEGWLDGNHMMPDDPRQFDLSDCVAIPGCQAAGITGHSDDVVFKFGTGFVTLKKGNIVTIGNDKANITIDAAGNMTLNATSIKVVTPAKTYVLESHRHTNVQTGTGTSGGPV